MAARDGEQELLADDRHGRQRRVVDRQRHQAEIRRARAQLAREPRRAAGQDLDVDVRMVPAEFLEQRRKDVEAHRHAADEPQRARQRLLGVEDALAGIADVREHPVAQLEQGLADRRDLDAPPEPDEQRFLELFLEQQNLPADGRLGDVQASAGRGKGAAFGDRPQDFQLSQIHCIRRTSNFRRLTVLHGLEEGHQRPQPRADLFDPVVLLALARLVEPGPPLAVLLDPVLRVVPFWISVSMRRISWRVSSVTMRGPPV